MLQVTTKEGLGRKRHYHVVYADPESGEVYVAEAGPKNNIHTHEAVVLDDGSIEILPGDDGHTHVGLEEYEPNLKSDHSDDSKIISNVLQLYKEATEISAPSRKKAEESELFYKGEQWSERQKSKLRELDRACITINKIGQGIDTLVGLQTQQRTDINILPQESTDQGKADILNIIIRHILYLCKYFREETKVFKDQAVTGLGAFHIYVDYNDSLEGNIKVEHYNWKDVMFGPHEKEDLSDCEYLLKEKMYSLAKLKQLWPDKADEIDKDFLEYAEVRNQGHVRYEGRQYAHSDNRYDVTPMLMGDHVMVDLARKEYRVLECWQKVYTRKKLLVNNINGEVFDADGWKKEDIKAVTRLGIFNDIERTSHRIRITRIAGGVVLSDEDPADLPENDFFIVPVYAYKSGHEFWGKVEAVKDAQRDVNKRYSQYLDIMNKAANYNHFYDDQTFPNKVEERKFLKTSSSPGAAFKVNNSERPPVMSQGVKVPAEIIHGIELADTQVAQLMNVVVESAGANESAGKFLHRQKQSLVGSEILFDNLSFAKEKLGRLLVRMIARYWNAERVYRLLYAENQKEPFSIDGIPFEQYAEEDIQAILEDSDITEFDITIHETEASPSTRFSHYLLLTELAQSGAVPIPPALLVELMPNAPDSLKQKLMGYLQQDQEAQAQEADIEGQTEINKTLIAKGIIPPEVQQRLQQGQQQAPQGPSEEVVEDSTQEVMPAPKKKTWKVTPTPDGGKVIEQFEDEVVQ